MPDPVTIAVVGAGNRGAGYARHAAAAGARIAAVAEKREFPRKAVAAEHDIAEVYDDWHELADRPRLADLVGGRARGRVAVVPQRTRRL